MKFTREKVGEFSGALSSFLGGASKVISIFNPPIGGALAGASLIADKISEIDDKTADKEIMGLSASVDLLDDIIRKYETGDGLDMDALKFLRENLKSLDIIEDKFNKILS